MWMDDFARKALEEVLRWNDLLEQEGIAALRETYRSVGAAELRSFAKDHEQILDALLRARSAAARAALLAKAPDTASRHALLLCASWRARTGHAYLAAAADRSLEPSPRTPSKELTANAAAAADAFREAKLPLWPFED